MVRSPRLVVPLALVTGALLAPAAPAIAGGDAPGTPMPPPTVTPSPGGAQNGGPPAILSPAKDAELTFGKPFTVKWNAGAFHRGKVFVRLAEARFWGHGYLNEEVPNTGSATFTVEKIAPALGPWDGAYQLEVYAPVQGDYPDSALTIVKFAPTPKAQGATSKSSGASPTPGSALALPQGTEKRPEGGGMKAVVKRDLDCHVEAFYDEARTKPVAAGRVHAAQMTVPGYVFVAVTVQNHGAKLPATGFSESVTFTPEKPPIPPQGFVTPPAGLAPGQSVTHAFKVRAWSGAVLRVDATADFTHRVAEDNEANNGCTLTLTGQP